MKGGKKMQEQMPDNPQKDNNSLTTSLSFLIGIPLTISIIEYSDSLRWYDFFWLFMIVCAGVGIILVVIKYLILNGLEKIANRQDLPVEKPNRNEEQGVTSVDFNSESVAHKKKDLPVNIDKLLKELNALIGLQQVKHEITTLINTVKINKLREEKELKQSPLSLHLVFSGNPGTGKTTVARILGKIYCRLGILSKGHLIETDMSGLVAGYIGQTAIHTKEIIEKAKGGILFIDEAYSLTPQNAVNDFGQEAIDTLLKAMEDYRDNFIVIVAGYPDLMKNLLKSNPGLQSRFNTFINFEDYNSNELLEIFMSLCKQHNYIVETNAIDTLTEIFEDIYSQTDESYANARTVRNFFEKTIKRQANRLANSGTLSKKDLQTLVIEDFFDKTE
jgi:SpoVK/Ycf46/Vps4 family AAA+-type ATPase